jgi:3-hydroxy acid dehydrogenase / malonic semialdehyde reductase
MNYLIITGATSGFGEATAKLFGSKGFNLILTGRRNERLEKLKSDLISLYKIDVLTLCFDVRIEAEVKQAISSIPNEISNQITLLINNAGLALGHGPIDQGDSSDWDQMIDTNVKGLLYVTKYVVPLLKKQETSHIVNIGSIAGKEVYPGGNVYCASKHAVDALSKAMRIDLVHHGIKVTNIAPGAAETEFSNVRFKGDQAIADSVYDGYTPLAAQDIAETIYFVTQLPKHVTINDLTIMPTAQASATVLHKSIE